MCKDDKQKSKKKFDQLPEFRYNHYRKHYSYVFGTKKKKYKNILLSSKPEENKTRDRRTVTSETVPLYRHPNPNKKDDKQYLVNRVYLDDGDNFDDRKKGRWKFHPYDRVRVKKIKKQKPKK